MQCESVCVLCLCSRKEFRIYFRVWLTLGKLTGIWNFISLTSTTERCKLIAIVWDVWHIVCVGRCVCVVASFVLLPFRL